jgi:hypothetical protein
MRELMEQKAGDFCLWREGKRIDDPRRLADGIVPSIIPSGDSVSAGRPCASVR